MVFAQGLLTDGERVVQEVCCLFVFILIPAVQSQLVIQGLDNTAHGKQNHNQQSSLCTDQLPLPTHFSFPPCFSQSLVLSGGLVVQIPYLCQKPFLKGKSLEAGRTPCHHNVPTW